MAGAAVAVMLAVALIALPAVAADDTTTTTAPTSSTTSPEPPATTTAASPTTTTTVAESSTAPGSEGDLAPEGELEDPEEELPQPAILFPIVGRASFKDTFGVARDGGAREHKGTDIFAANGTPVVAVASGVIQRVGEGDLAGQYVTVRHDDGWVSAYVHLTNDTPGTDDGLGVGFAPGVEVGRRVAAGALLGYVGDSGNAEDSSPHLHFELHQPDGLRTNPAPALVASTHSGSFQMLSTLDYDDVQTRAANLIGHTDPNGSGFNAEVTVEGHHAYLGTWGNNRRCPQTGVRIVDVTDPSVPALVGSFATGAEFPATSAATVWVGQLDNEHFAGRLGVVGLKRCDVETGTAGIAVYALDDPASPVLLSLISMDQFGVGVDDIAVRYAGDRLLVAAITGADLDEAAVWVFDMANPGAAELTALWRAPANDGFEGESESDPELGTAEAESTVPTRHRLEWLGASLRLAVGIAGGGVTVLETDSVIGPWPLLTLPGPDVVERDDGLLQGAFMWADGVDSLRIHQQGSALAGPGAFPGVLDTHTILDLVPEGTVANFVEDYGDLGILVGDDGGHLSLYGMGPDGLPVELAVVAPAPVADPQWWWPRDRSPMVWDVDVQHGRLYVSDANSGLWIFDLDVSVEPQESDIATD